MANPEEVRVLPAAMGSEPAMGDVAKLLLVVLVLLGILAFVVRILRPLMKWIVTAGLLLMVGGVWLSNGGAGTADDSEAPAEGTELEVRAAVRGGWDVTVPEIDGATAYAIDLDGQRVATSDEPGVVHVSDPDLSDRDYAPGPVRTMGLTVSVAGQQFESASQPFCSPVVLLAARGTNENPGKEQFGNGIGSRNWRTWLYLARQAGVAPDEAGVVPSVIGAAPVHYDATALDYVSSRNGGKDDLRQRLRAVARDCPDSRVVLIGYSQGADVVGSVWQAQPAGSAKVLGVISYADPRFNRDWVDQGIVWPQGAVFKNDGMLGARGLFPPEATDGLQVWCLPKDPVCQEAPRPLPWHGDAYDVYEEWAAYNLAPYVIDFLDGQGFPTATPVAPTQEPSTEGR